MAVTINASTTAGLVQTADTSGVLALQTAGTTAVTVDASQNVGIGTSSPTGKLHVSGFVLSGGQNYSARFSDAVNSTYSIAHQSGLTNLITDTAMAFYSSNTERMRIDSSGNVGIGTTTINAKVQIQVGDNAPAASGNMNTGVVIQAATGQRALNMGANNTGGYSWINAAFANNSGVADNLVLMTGATERMRIDTSGNLLFNSGYGSVATAYGCRAWVNFDGTGTPAIRASGNVSSIGDNGVGNYTVNLGTSMPDANYSALAVDGSSGNNVNAMTYTYATGSFRVTIQTGTTAAYQDSSKISCAIFR